MTFSCRFHFHFKSRLSQFLFDMTFPRTLLQDFSSSRRLFRSLLVLSVLIGWSQASSADGLQHPRSSGERFYGVSFPSAGKTWDVKTPISGGEAQPVSGGNDVAPAIASSFRFRR